MHHNATTDVLVIGLGAVGAATLLGLARRGVRAMGVDRFDPPHANGSTHGETRITRLAVAEGAEYVPLVRRSHAIWRELEAETGETLFIQNGGLIIATGDGAPSHGQPGFLGSTIAVAREHAIPHEILDAAETRHRWPQFLIQDSERAYFEPTAGVLFPERAVTLQLRLARQHGATIRINEQVLSIERHATGVTVATDQGRIDAGRAILAAGAWVPGLARIPQARVHRQSILWVDPQEPGLYTPEACPIYIWQHGAGEEDYLYGFPAIPGGSGVKLGSERYGPGIDPDHVDRTVPEHEWRTILDRHVKGRMRGLADRPTRTGTCLYTCTPDAGFIIDCAERLITASTCSGHGFKHSPALGEHLADLALDQATALPAFAPDRFTPDRFAPAPLD
jgi:sarcosine oxidase